jgi:hypothetical protein
MSFFFYDLATFKNDLVTRFYDLATQIYDLATQNVAKSFLVWQIHFFGVLGHFLSHDRFWAKV